MGTPQGSVLGPILFLLYTNNVSLSSTVFNFSIFADDTCLVIKLERENYNSKLSIELTKVMDWFTANSLLLNYDKTQYMYFGPHYRKHYDKQEPRLQDQHDCNPLSQHSSNCNTDNTKVTKKNIMKKRIFSPRPSHKRTTLLNL